ncbi:MAG: DUF5615 family PIN-like protein [Chloroflexi bacterium]|nr:DUF5615 family PIN-like protein [Chloroflexota bacterium]
MPSFVLDEDLSRSTAKMLRDLGHDAEAIRDTAMAGEADDIVYAYAQEKRAILFSADLGFANIQKFPLGTHWGIVGARFPNKLPTGEVNKCIRESLSQIPNADFKGNLIIIEPGRIRLRRFKPRPPNANNS